MADEAVAKSYAARLCLDFMQLFSTPMSLDLDAKKTLLRKIPHGLFICGVRDGDEVNGFTASWVTQGSFEPPLVVMGVRADSTSHGIIERTGCFSLNVLRADRRISPPCSSTSEGDGGAFRGGTLSGR